MRNRLHKMETEILHSTQQIDQAKKHEIAIRQKQMEIERQRVRGRRGGGEGEGGI